jgi:hypothetical protein
MRVRVKTLDGERSEQIVEGGSLWVYPLTPGQQVEVEVTALARGTHIGGRRRVRTTLSGGTLGLIFDARGRPLPLAMDARGRAEQMPAWLAQATGNPVQPIDPRWLEVGSTPQPQPKAVAPRRQRQQPKPARQPRQRGRRGGQQEASQEEIEFDFDDLRG